MGGLGRWVQVTLGAYPLQPCTPSSCPHEGKGAELTVTPADAKCLTSDWWSVPRSEVEHHTEVKESLLSCLPDPQLPDTVRVHVCCHHHLPDLVRLQACPEPVSSRCESAEPCGLPRSQVPGAWLLLSLLSPVGLERVLASCLLGSYIGMCAVALESENFTYASEEKNCLRCFHWCQWMDSLISCISFLTVLKRSVQFSSVAKLCPTLCDPMDCSMRGLPVHHQLPEFTQTHVL